MRGRKVLSGVVAVFVAVFAAGFVLAFARDPGAILGRQVVFATGPATLRRGVEETFAIRVARHGSGRPVAGALVRVLREGAPKFENPELARGATGPDGTVVLGVRAPDGVAEKLPLAVVVESPLGEERIALAPAIVEGGPGAERALLAPSKTLYQPGEKLEARALVLGAAGAAAGVPVGFDLLAPTGARVARVRAATSAFGIASAAVALDAQAPEGAWTLRLLRFVGARDEEAGALLAERTVHVRRYRLPALRVEVRPERRTVRRGESFSAAVAALAFDGRPVAGAEVKAILRDDRGDELATAEAVADARGEAKVAFTVPATFDLGPVRERRIFVEVEALDRAGRPARGAAALFASEVPLRVSALPEGGALVPGVENRVHLVLEGPGGAPLEGEVEVLRDYRAGPVRLATGAEGVARWDGVLPDAEEVAAGKVEVRVTARAKEGGAEATETLAIRVDRAAAGVLRCERAVVAEGERVPVELLPAPALALRAGTALVLLLEREGRTVATGRVVADEDGRARGEIAPPPGSTGFHRLVALVPHEDGVKEVARRLLVRQELEVTVEADRAEYAPGDEATIRARVRRRDGKPVEPAAIGLQAIDRAVAELGHAFDVRAAVLRVALGGDPEEGRLGRGFAAGLLGGAGADEVARAALGGLALRESAAERIEATTAPACRARDRAFARNVERAGEVAVWAVVPAILIGLLVLFPRTVGALLGIGALLVAGLVASPRAGMQLDMAEVQWGARPPAPAATAPAPRNLNAESAWLAEMPGGKVTYVFKLEEKPEGGPELTSTAHALRPPEPRSYFPEALLFAPELLTDEKGEASITVRMPDALTEWRIDAVASTRAGAIAHARSSMVTRQRFQVDLHAPAFVRLGDEVEVTAAVRNDGERAVGATVALERAAWFEALSPLEAREVRVGAGEVAAARFRIRAIRAGDATITLRADGAGLSDAARRPIAVLPGGRLLTRVANADLSAASPVARLTVAIPGGSRGTERALVLRLPADPAVEAIEGIEALLREPHGCFEQTSSTTWPNTLVLGYLRRLPERRPEAEERAAKYVRQGYQRLLGFEVERSGGFSLYGRAPASPWLTAYGLRELTDIAKEIDVDPALLARVRAFLFAQQREDGGFAVTQRMAHQDMAPGGTESDLGASAYVLAALAASGATGDEVDRAGAFVARSIARPDEVPIYALALAAEALQLWGKRPDVAAAAADALARRARRPADGAALAFDAGEARTLVGAYGRSAEAEITAIAARVLRRDRRHAALGREAARALVGLRTGAGWGTTQATVQALASLIEGAEIGGPAKGRIEVRVAGRPVEVVNLGDAGDPSATVALEAPADGSPVEVELRGELQGTVAAQVIASARVPWDVEAADAGAAAPGAQGAAQHRAPGRPLPGRPLLAVAVNYRTREVAVGDALPVRVTVRNEGAASAVSPMLEVPFPAGFELADDRPLRDLVAKGDAHRFDETGSGFVLYLADLAAGAERALDLRIVARHAGVLASGAACAYPYYNPEDAAFARPVAVRVVR